MRVRPGWKRTILLNPAGTTKLSGGQLFRNIRLNRLLDFRQGPDGALYAINYAGWFAATASTSLVRIEYSGTFRPANVTGTLPGASSPGHARLTARGRFLDMDGNGRHLVRVTDDPAADYTLPG